MTRVTQAGISATALRGLQGSLGRMQALQQQLSSGKRIARASDDPSATVTAMTFRSQQAADVQYLRNIDQATGRLGVADNALTQMSDRFRALRELMLQGQNPTLGPDGQAALSSQASSLASEIVGLYNTTYLDRPVFGGTVAGQQAVDPASGAYLGDDQPVTAQIGQGQVVRVDVPGTSVGADTTPALLDSIVAELGAGGGVSSANFDALDAAMSKVQQALGNVGALEQRVQLTRGNVDAHRLDLTSRISQSEDVDLPETIMNLQAQQVAYQSSLAAAARINQTSLVDFLK